MRSVFSYFLGLLFAIGALPGQAGVVISGTRVIYPSEAKSVVVQVSNEGKQPALVQSWIDEGESSSKPEKIAVPFLLTPPINRIEPGRGQTLRIQALNPGLPTDRETIFWLNVLEIPPVSPEIQGQNYMQIAFRSRIKLFYRPAGLTQANESAAKMKWSVVPTGLRATNPTPFYISLIKVRYGDKPLEGHMIPPFSEWIFQTAISGKVNTVSADALNDYGAVITNSYSLQR